jgi:Ca2+-binding RTX toxin-like protein
MTAVTAVRVGLVAVLVETAMTLSPVSGTAMAGNGATCQGVRATILGTDGDDDLIGTSGDDVIVAGGGDDTADAGAGDDLVCGGTGADDLTGGVGNDRLYGELDSDLLSWPEGDRLMGGAGDDLVDPGRDPRHRNLAVNLGDWISFREATSGVTVDLAEGTASGEGNDTLVITGFVHVEGTDHGDRVLGSARPDVVSALDGHDVVRGRGGADVLVSGHAVDNLVVDDDATGDVFEGGRGRDYLVAATADDVLRGGVGSDTLVVAGGHGIGGPGDDDVVVRVRWSDSRLRLRGSQGGDKLNVVVEDHVDGSTPTGVVDVPRGKFSVRAGRRATSFRIKGFERFSLTPGQLAVRRGGHSRLVAPLGAGDRWVRGRP